MKFESLEVSNYRAITAIDMQNLADTIIVAGPNGCGKSCVFDAIRLLKSTYGGYQPNEWQSFFGEFQIRIGQRPGELLQIFQDKTKPLRIAANITFAADEINYLRAKGKEILKDTIWKELVPELASWRFIGVQPMATHLRVHEPEVTKRTEETWPHLLNQLERPTHRAELIVNPTGQITALPSMAVELVWSVYDPQNLGVLDYHGSTRNYQREQVGGINLNIESAEDQMRQHSLYNYMNKYANLKTQMASGYVRNLLISEIGGSAAKSDNLIETLKELFQTFFPGKEFLGPQPTSDGRLLFPVRLLGGGTHDIDELSSGEKEVLYGYLRLRNSAPKNSVVLIDEPELHLNPRLIQGLARFYHKHIGRALGNQIWLVSHSDTLIRDAVGQDGFSIFHMQAPDHLDSINQLSEVKGAEDVERIVIELVGDLAAYRPESKIVIFEGGGDSNFDVQMVGALFPEVIARINAIAGGNKRRVRDLYEILERTRVEAQVPAKFYSITDRDDERLSAAIMSGTNAFCWDAYHIENYLLEPNYIHQVLDELLGNKTGLKTAASVTAALKKCAEETIPGLVIRQLRAHSNRIMVKALDLGVDPNATDVSSVLNEAITRSREKFLRVLSDELDQKSLKALEIKILKEAQASLKSHAWRTELRGRDILKRFVGKHGKGVAYEYFRNLILARMRDDSFKPDGMRAVFEKIVDGGAIGPVYRPKTP